MLRLKPDADRAKALRERAPNEITTVDTGERKESFGFTARRVTRTHKVIPLDDTTSARRRRSKDGWYIDLDTRSGERPTARSDDLLRRAIDSWIAKRGSGFVSIAAQVRADDIHRETRDRISDLGQDDAPIFPAPAGSSTGDHKRNRSDGVIDETPRRRNFRSVTRNLALATARALGAMAGLGASPLGVVQTCRKRERPLVSLGLSVSSVSGGSASEHLVI